MRLATSLIGVGDRKSHGQGNCDHNAIPGNHKIDQKQACGDNVESPVNASIPSTSQASGIRIVGAHCLRALLRETRCPASLAITRCPVALSIVVVFSMGVGNGIQMALSGFRCILLSQDWAFGTFADGTGFRIQGIKSKPIGDSRPPGSFKKLREPFGLAGSRDSKLQMCLLAFIQVVNELSGARWFGRTWWGRMVYGGRFLGKECCAVEPSHVDVFFRPLHRFGLRPQTTLASVRKVPK